MLRGSEEAAGVASAEHSPKVKVPFPLLLSPSSERNVPRTFDRYACKDIIKFVITTKPQNSGKQKVVGIVASCISPGDPVNFSPDLHHSTSTADDVRCDNSVMKAMLP